MMDIGDSPFTPDQPVSPDLFLTRMKKLGALEMPKNTRGEYQFPDIFHYFYLCRSHQEKGKRK